MGIGAEPRLKIGVAGLHHGLGGSDRIKASRFSPFMGGVYLLVFRRVIALRRVNAACSQQSRRGLGVTPRWP